MAKKTTVSKKKKLKNIPNGIAYIHSTFNNTVVTITDSEGKVVIWKSGGTSGFKGTKKGTPFAAQIAAEQAAQVAIENRNKNKRAWIWKRSFNKINPSNRLRGN